MAEARGAASSGAGATGWASSLGSRLDVARKGLGRGLAWAGGAAVISSLAVVATRFQAQRVCVCGSTGGRQTEWPLPPSLPQHTHTHMFTHLAGRPEREECASANLSVQ